MAVKYTDSRIGDMILESKPLPSAARLRLRLREKIGHKERRMDVLGASGTRFRLILRQSVINVLDFSIVLGVLLPGSSRIFRLRRYNGKSHQHTNRIEGDTFYDFHIHQATERYQESGFREDAYAEVTDRYADFHTALRCLLSDCGFAGAGEV